MSWLAAPPVRAARAVWKAAPVPYALRRAVASRVWRALDPHPGGADPRILYRPDPRTLRAGGLLLSGYLSSPTGIGRGGRMSAAALAAGGAQPRLHDLARDPAGQALDDLAPGGVWFAHCNAPEALHFMHVAAHPAVYERRYRIGYWAWELPRLPQDWLAALPLFHEVWAPSRFVADAVRAAAGEDGPRVRVAPHPLPDMSRARDRRERFGAAAGEFVVLAMYDVRSTTARKNPEGAVEAFQRAFAPADTSVRLLLKVNAPADDPEVAAPLRARTAGWPNITLLVEELSDGEADDLLASCDVFVSLHRAEGFGLSIAQAMALGRAVVATAWSGNVDFQAGAVEEIPYALVPARDPSGRYELPDQCWAEPDLQAAAAALRRLATDRDASRGLGERARAAIEVRLPRSYPAADLAPWLAG